MPAMLNEQFGMLSRFLPVVNEEFTRDALRIGETSSAAYRVLIMEKSVSLAKLLATGLSTESFAVDVTHDMGSAARLANSCSFDLAILDVGFPRRKALHCCKTSAPRIPMSGFWCSAGKRVSRTWLPRLSTGLTTA